MLVNAIVGLRAVDHSALDVLRVLDASRAQVFWKLRLPSSLPYVFAALRISVPLSLIGAVGAEFLSGAELGRASLRERGVQSVEISVVAVSLTKKKVKKK